MNVTPCENFSLEHTINSGQFFYYFKEGDSYVIITRNQIFRVKQIKDNLYYSGVDENTIRTFFQLDFDLNALYYENIPSQLEIAVKKYWGLRIIKQDLWQTIVGFVCSAAANIEKIKTNIQLISRVFGEKVVFEGKIYYLFPELGTLIDEEKLKEAKTGYRSKYLFKINQEILKNPSLLEEIGLSEEAEALSLLQTLPGVGSKVANCIALFSLQNYECFPVDTWIAKIMNNYFLLESNLSPKQIEKKIDDFFPKGNYRGIHQQYLFHYERNLS